jgi:hypothetical protein
MWNSLWNTIEQPFFARYPPFRAVHAVAVLCSLPSSLFLPIVTLPALRPPAREFLFLCHH